MTKITTKQQVLSFLHNNSNRYISGQEIADSIYVTRAAVWKAIKTLENEGYEIEAVTNRGYRLKNSTGKLDRDVIVNMLHMREEVMDKLTTDMIVVYEEVDSTNNVAKEYAVNNPGMDAVIIASSQRAGRGRRGRTFYSPEGSGIYMSFLIHPDIEITKATSLTCFMACIICQSIFEITGVEPNIKWVNDILIGGKKVAGILTEAITSIEDGGLDYVIIGVGINVFEPSDGFPKEIRDLAGAIMDAADMSNQDIINRLCADIVNRFFSCIARYDDVVFLEEYRNRMMLTGSYVKVTQFRHDVKVPGSEYAYVTGIDDQYRLCVKYENGREDALSTGEVSVIKY